MEIQEYKGLHELISRFYIMYFSKCEKQSMENELFLHIKIKIPQKLNITNINCDPKLSF